MESGVSCPEGNGKAPLKDCHAAKEKRMAENVEVVKMSDGREVSFAGKRKAIKSSDFVNGEVQVRIDFRNGESKLYSIPKALTEKAACHGGEQKYGDSYA